MMFTWKVVFEAGLSSNHPFSPTLSKHDYLCPGLHPYLSQPTSKLLCLITKISVRSPVVIPKVVLGKNFPIRLNFLLLSQDLSGSQALSVIELPHHMREDLLQGVEIVPPDIPVDRGRLNNGVEHHLPIFSFIPLGMYPFPMLSYPPWLLDQVPDGVSNIVIDMTYDVDEYDKEFEERVEDPAIGHVSA